MIYALSADIVVLLHLSFILYVVLGGLLVWRWPWTVWVHIPVALYGIAIEWIGWVCPLTPLEKECRRFAGQAGYDGGFIDHYLLPIIYPSGLTDRVQLVLGGLVLAVNLGVYAAIFVLRKRES